MTATKSDGAITTFVTSYVNWAGSFICYPASKLSGGRWWWGKRGEHPTTRTPQRASLLELTLFIRTVCGPWSAPFPKMIKYFVEKKNTLNNERYRDLLISILSCDEVSAFLLRMKARN